MPQLPDTAASQPVNFESTAGARDELTSATRLKCAGLLIVALIAAATGLVALFQAAARQHSASASEQHILGALGFTRSATRRACAFMGGLPAVLAAALTAGGIVLAGVVEPLGGTRSVRAATRFRAEPGDGRSRRPSRPC